MRAGVQPGHAAPHDVHPELTHLKVVPVKVGYFKLPARGGLEGARDLHHMVVVEIKSSHRVSRFGMRGPFFDRADFVRGIEFDHPVALRVVHRISEHLGPGSDCRRGFEVRHQIMTMKNIITENER